ncbi:hypothetical protein IU500_14665 [Nocardia terpenica]|uniref:hypothetical protein n=1 Tax=Nocardia terpenica TaxID=455432 RepID=UPI00189445E0|nr:hypothetical protein [Nocardia terpenica]MBF6061484.1 hypothetical protein [Nocardia terpenica]MBF6105287.1 hypothetical protein [Nocardia terpenica]MBF6113243.1 hypothetical protein [Nocardia terpenica]MBF6119373.1 hypothetical protein [Nocardia terpenica]MBF6153021.1 hypothetical protein [Nocardia terpenica]
MDDITAEQARAALDAADRARRQVAAEVGLPRGYWWVLAVGWLLLGVVGQYGPWWLITVATVGFGAGHSMLASRLLDGRRRTQQLRVSSAVAGHRTPVVVVGMLLGFVVVTIGAGFALHGDGVRHAGIWAGVLVAAIIGWGGPEILRVLRRWARA